MSVKEMIYKFMVEATKIDSTFKPLTEDILHYLNKSQLFVLDDIYKSDVQNVDSNRIIKDRIDLLTNLIISVKVFPDLINISEPSVDLKTTQPTGVYYIDYEKAIKLPIPTDYLYYIESKSKVNGTWLTVEDKFWVIDKYVTKEETGSIITSYYNIPILRQPCVYIQDSMFVITDSYTSLYNVELTYIKTPKLLSVFTDDSTHTTISEIHESYHVNIVDKAVKLYKQDNTIIS